MLEKEEMMRLRQVGNAQSTSVLLEHPSLALTRQTNSPSRSVSLVTNETRANRVNVGFGLKQNTNNGNMTIVSGKHQWSPPVLGACIHIGATLQQRPDDLQVFNSTQLSKE